jgi:hypothetical protein
MSAEQSPEASEKIDLGISPSSSSSAPEPPKKMRLRVSDPPHSLVHKESIEETALGASEEPESSHHDPNRVPRREVIYETTS